MKPSAAILLPDQLVPLPGELAKQDSLLFQDCERNSPFKFDSFLDNTDESQRDLRFFIQNRLLLAALLDGTEDDALKWSRSIDLLKPDTAVDLLQNMADWYFTQFIDSLWYGSDWEKPFFAFLHAYEKIFGVDHIRMVPVLHFGIYILYQSSTDPNLVIDLLGKERHILERYGIEDMRLVQNQYYYGGTYCLDLKSHQDAIPFLENAKSIYPQQQKEDSSLDFYEILNLLGACYGQLNDSVGVRQNFEASMAILKQRPDKLKDLLFTLTSYTTALTYINGFQLIDSIANEFYAICPSDKYIPLADYERSLAYVYKGLQKHDLAIEYFSRAITTYEKEEDKKNLDNSYYVDALYGLAELQIYNGDLEDGFRVLQKASLAWSGKPLDDVLFNTPLISILYKTDANYFLESGAEYFRQKWYLDPSNENDYQKALLIYHRLSELYSIMNQSLLQENLFSNIKVEFRAYSKVIDLLVRKFETNPDRAVLDKALSFIEKAKYGMLLSKVSLDSLAKKYAVPDRIQARANQLYEREKLHFSGSKVLNHEDLKGLINEKGNFKDSLENDFPGFYRSMNDPPRINMGASRSYAQQNQATLVQYHTFNNQVYCMATNGDEDIFLRLPFDSFERKSLAHFMSLVSNYPSHQKRTKGDVRILDSISHQLYRLLVKPIEHLISGKKNICISAGGPLEYLPFEALSQSLSKVTSSTFDLDYLGNHHDIQYGFSWSTLMLHPIDQVNLSTKDLFAFAYAGLAGSGNELKSIRRNWEKKKLHSFAPKRATKHKFRNVLANGGIVHAATHASADNENRFGGRLFFNGHDGILELAELLTVQMQSPLVVLSACQTGSGLQLEGEGTYSIARPFILSGADRVIVSHWNIHDDSTSRLMPLFYKYLKMKNAPGYSLAQAKRAFLKMNPDQSHPYFWSGIKLVS